MRIDRVKRATGGPRRHRTAWMEAVLVVLLVATGSVAGAEPPEDRSKARPEIRYETEGPIPTLSPVPNPKGTKTVLLTDDRLHPRLVRLEPGESVTWLSYAQQPSRISFSRDVARSMVCRAVVNFQVDESRLRSGPLVAGDSASFCELAPGTYRYRIERDPTGTRATTGGRQLSSRLEGLIVVDDRSPVAAR